MPLAGTKKTKETVDGKRFGGRLRKLAWMLIFVLLMESFCMENAFAAELSYGEDTLITDPDEVSKVTAEPDITEPSGERKQAAEETDITEPSYEVKQESALSDAVAPDNENTTDVTGQENHKAVTVMLYMVASDLESSGAYASKDLYEIIDSIYNATVIRSSGGGGDIHTEDEGPQTEDEHPHDLDLGSGPEDLGVSDEALSGGTEDQAVSTEALGSDEGDCVTPEYSNETLRTPSINFVVETGGMRQMSEAQKEAYDKVRKDYIKGKTTHQKKIWQSLSDISFYENQRWILSGDGIEKAKNDKDIETDRNVIMTKSDENGVVTELKDFIDTTTRDYPADQYMLILWDHGFGALKGYGYDTRSDYDAIDSAEIIQTMNSTGVFANDGKKLALVGYDACLMAGLETCLAWAPFARYFAGSEQEEGENGWNYSRWVGELEKEVNRRAPGYYQIDENADELTRNVGQYLINDFVSQYADNATGSLVSLGEVITVSEKLGELSNDLIGLMEEAPLETYQILRRLRQDTVGFGAPPPATMDIRSFADNVKLHLGDMIGKTELPEDSSLAEQITADAVALENSIKQAVIKERHTSDMGAIGGLTVYFPYSAVNHAGYQDEWAEYRDMYDGLAGDYEVPDPYMDMVSLYMSILGSGKKLKDDNAKLSDVDREWNALLEKYNVNEYKESGSLNKLPEKLMEHRIQNEALKIGYNGEKYKIYRHDITLLDEVYQELLTYQSVYDIVITNNFGQLPTGDYGFSETEEAKIWEQVFDNFEAKKWFSLGSQTLPFYHIECDGDALKDEAEVYFPVINIQEPEPESLKLTLYMAVAHFKAGKSVGEVTGAWLYNTHNGEFSRYISADKLPAYGYFWLVPLTKDGRFRESGGGTGDEFSFPQIISRGVDVTGYDQWTMKPMVRDIFDNTYAFDSFKQEITVSASLREGLKAKQKGVKLSLEDIEVTLKDTDGTVLDHNEDRQKLSFSFVDKDGKARPLYIGEDGDFHYLDAQEKDTVLILESDTEIILSETATDPNLYEMIDYATVSLKDNFNLTFEDGGNRFTVPVYDPDKDGLTVKATQNPYYYLAYIDDGLTKEEFSNYFTVLAGDIDITGDRNCELSFGYRIKGETKFVSCEGIISPDLNLKPGDEIAVYVSWMGKQADNEASPIVIGRNPVDITGTKEVTSERLSDLTVSYESDICLTYYDYKGNEIKDIPEAYYYKSLLEITDKKTATIDTVGVDITIAHTYEGLPMNPDGKWKDNFTDYFKPEKIILANYTVTGATRVCFRSGKDLKDLATPIVVGEGATVTAGRIAVNDKVVEIEGNKPVEWYFKVGTANPVIVYQNDAAVSYRNLNLVEWNTGDAQTPGWKFYLPEGLGDTDVIFYAGYATEVKNAGTKDVIIDPITPVEFTGKSIVTTMSTKSGSKVLGLKMHSSDGTKNLIEGEDYTVSYKNNKNAADINSSKPPTLIIKGKGTYKGLKCEVYFTILPADFSNASIKTDSLFVPLTSDKKKGVKLNANVYLPGGFKVPQNRMELHYYRKDENGLRSEITPAELASLYNSNQIIRLCVSATAVVPPNKSSNYVTGSRIDPANEAVVYAYPKQNKLKISLKKSKYDYSNEAIRLSNILAENNIKSLKVGGKTIAVDKIKAPKAYLDKAFTIPLTDSSGNELSAITDAGTYYIAVELKDEYKAQYGFYSAQVATVKIAGKKLAKKNMALADTKITIGNRNERDPQPLPVVLQFDSDFKWETLRAVFTTRDGGSVERTLKATDAIEDNGIKSLTFDDIDNGAPGTYKVTIYGEGEYTGSITYSYKVAVK